MDNEDIFADYSYWLEVPLWNHNEAAALLRGFDPVKMSREVFREISGLQRTLERAQLAGQLGKSNANYDSSGQLPLVRPKDWIEWADRNQVTCSSKLMAALEKRIASNEHSEDKIHPRRETTLLRIIGALVQELLRDSTRSQATVVRKIVDLHGHKPGISVSTIDKIFSQANRHLNDW